DGSKMGLQGMINHMLEYCDFNTTETTSINPHNITEKDPQTLARCITAIENGKDEILRLEDGQLLDGDNHIINSSKNGHPIPLVGITGTGGAGKSSLTDELIRRFLMEFEDLTIAVISIDPSKVRTGGALLGDRIRMN